MGYEGLWVYTGFAKNRLQKSGKIFKKSEYIFGVINDTRYYLNLKIFSYNGIFHIFGFVKVKLSIK